MDSKNSLIVAGEASESDDDDYIIPPEKHKEGKSVTFNGAIIIESENDSDDNFTITAEAFQSKYEETKQYNSRYNTLLHKKLKESNCRLYEDTYDVVKSTYRFANVQIKEISARLLEAQTETEETQKNLRSSLIAMERVDWALNDLMTTKFMPRINLKL